MSESGQLPDNKRREYIVTLCKVCGSRGILLASHIITTDGLNKVSEFPAGDAGFSDV
jgi:hypothetical protein